MQNLYQKYRPQTFAEIVGQDHIVKTLSGALLLNKVSHAYLFCGSRGTGKTSTARILAKTVNCVANRQQETSNSKYETLNNENNSSKKTGKMSPVSGLKFNVGIEPCNTCESCLEISNGSSLDVVEIDAASARGIDDIRELRENIKFSPAKAKFKVFIIDEVHMLTKEAFNALLKTLEEPPSYAIFILATTEVHKVPETIISRCQMLDFRRITISDISKNLENIAKKENILISRGSITKIALKANGSHRDSLSILNQLAGISNEVNDSLITEVLGYVNETDIYEMVEIIGKKDLVGGIDFLIRLSESGTNFEEFLKSLIIHFRDLLVAKTATTSALDTAKEIEETINKQSEFFNESELVEIITQLLVTKKDLELVPLPAIAFELFLSRIITKPNNASEKTEKTKGETKKKDQALVDENPKINENFVEEKEEIALAENPKKSEKPKVSSAKKSLPNQDSSIKSVKEKWPLFLEELKKHNHSLRALLLNATPVSLSENVLTIGFKFAFHAEKSGTNENKKILESVLSKILEKDIELNIVRENTAKTNNKNETFLSALEVLGGEVVD